MKYVIRKTGEIVDVIDSHTVGICERVDGDYVSYIDSKGKEHQMEKMNLDWDFIGIRRCSLDLKAQIAMKVIEGTDLRKDGAAIDVVNKVNTIWKGIKYD